VCVQQQNKTVNEWMKTTNNTVLFSRLFFSLRIKRIIITFIFVRIFKFDLSLTCRDPCTNSRKREGKRLFVYLLRLFEIIRYLNDQIRHS